MERMETFDHLRTLLNGQRPIAANCYHLLEGYRAAVEDARLYADAQRGALLLLEEETDAFRAFGYLYDETAPFLLTAMPKPLLMEVILREGDARAISFAAYWQRVGFTPVRTRVAMRGMPASQASARKPADTRISSADEARAWETLTLFRQTMDVATVRLPKALPPAHVLCANAPDGRLVGALHFTPVSGGSVLEHIAVYPDARRQGIADALMRAWLNLPHGDKRTLWVIEDNAPAIALYTAHGFTPLPRRCLSLLYGVYQQPKG